MNTLTEKASQDYLLVCSAQNNNQQAFAELMSRYQSSIYFFLLKKVNNRDDARDLTMEAFGKAFKSIHSYTPDYAFSTWLFKIASNNCVDFIRKKRMVSVSIDATFENEDGERPFELPSDAITPEESLIKKQRASLIRAVVNKLKPRYKRLVEMRYFEERSYEEIASELQLPLGTVKAQLFRAREYLYKSLTK